MTRRKIKKSKVTSEVAFAWMLLIDAAFIRSGISFGFKTLHEYFAAYAGADRQRHLASWLKKYRQFLPDFSATMLLNPNRWALFNYTETVRAIRSHTDVELIAVLELYEQWIRQQAHLLYHYNRTDIPREVHRMLLWDITCQLGNDATRLELVTAAKMSPEKLYLTATVAKLPVHFTEHPWHGHNSL